MCGEPLELDKTREGEGYWDCFRCLGTFQFFTPLLMATSIFEISRMMFNARGMAAEAPVDQAAHRQ